MLARLFPVSGPRSSTSMASSAVADHASWQCSQLDGVDRSPCHCTLYWRRCSDSVCTRAPAVRALPLENRVHWQLLKPSPAVQGYARFTSSPQVAACAATPMLCCPAGPSQLRQLYVCSSWALTAAHPHPCLP
jgi:hypothetical protein